MDQVIIGLGWIGVYASVGLGAIASAIACTRAGQAACGAMMEVESGYGKFVGVAAMPSSQTIYGIVVMLQLMSKGVGLANAIPLFIIGTFTGLALYISCLKQGECCASAINASKNKPEIFGISIAPAAIVEGFSVFAFVFSLVLIGNIPAVIQ
jgi:V/A-type H+-transporting ATPase subunit K